MREEERAELLTPSHTFSHLLTPSHTFAHLLPDAARYIGEEEGRADEHDGSISVSSPQSQYAAGRDWRSSILDKQHEIKAALWMRSREARDAAGMRRFGPPMLSRMRSKNNSGCLPRSRDAQTDAIDALRHPLSNSVLGNTYQISHKAYSF